MMSLLILTVMLAAQAFFTEADVATRRKIMRAATTNPDPLTLIEAGLQDSDAQVRFSAIGALTQLNMGGVDPKTRPTLVPVLLQALDDPDFRIRGGVVKGLGLMIEPASSSAIQAALLSRYAREPDADVRAVIVNDLATYAIDAPDVQQLSVDALSDESAAVRRRAAMAVAKIRPGVALPRVVAELESGVEETRSEFVYALESYGALAKPHLRLLEILLTRETRNAYKEQIRQAIRTIQDSR